jgi:N-acetylneuraminic acid mutarotase
MFDLQTRKWTELEKTGPWPCARHNHSACLWRGTDIVVFGGANAESKYLNDLWLFDVRARTWSLLQPQTTAPAERNGHSAVIYGDAMFVFGGSSADCTYYNDLHRVDLSTRVWSPVQTLLSVPPTRNWHSAILYGSVMVVFGGYYYDGRRENYRSDLWVIDLSDTARSSWVELTPMSDGSAAATAAAPAKSIPHARNRHIALLVNDCLVVHGGNYLDDSGSRIRDVFLSDAFAVDLRVLRDLDWTTGVAPVARWQELARDGAELCIGHHTVAALPDGSAVVFGGECNRIRSNTLHRVLIALE